ncbi:MAG: divalent-cation tolerance protein CutA [Candidatus Omnitrophica bacterium]|nr:divalent-cation tolerance protein CutA [Candidatus Omnitrophota bacterium]
MRAGHIVIFVTCSSREEAETIAGALLSGKIAACANIIPDVKSNFWWKGRIDSADETLLVLKTTKRNFRKAEKAVRRLHSYEVPEIIALPIAAGSKAYLGWITKSVK